MTILQKILAWLAGQSENLPETNVRTESLLKAAAEKIKSGLLPAATAEDVGKAVMVGETGAYELGEAGGGDSNIEYVNIIATMDEHHQISFSADKNYAEIADLINAGKQVFYKNDTWGCSLGPVQEHASGTFFATFFNRAEIFSTPKTVIFDTFSIDSSNTLKRTQSTVSAT